MRADTVALFAEATLLGGPATAVTLYAVPFLFAFPIAIAASTWEAAPLVTVIWFGVAAFAVFEYWRLALATARGRRYRLSARLAVGLAGAVVGTVQFVRWWGSYEAALVIAPMGVAAAHFLILQWRRRNDA